MELGHPCRNATSAEAHESPQRDGPKHHRSREETTGGGGNAARALWPDSGDCHTIYRSLSRRLRAERDRSSVPTETLGGAGTPPSLPVNARHREEHLKTRGGFCFPVPPDRCEAAVRPRCEVPSPAGCRWQLPSCPHHGAGLTGSRLCVRAGCRSYFTPINDPATRGPCSP